MIRISWVSPRSVYVSEAVVSEDYEKELSANDKEQVLWEAARWLEKRAKAYAAEKRDKTAYNIAGKCKGM